MSRLPNEIKDLIANLREAGRTVDEIREHLADLLSVVPSRSALGRHIAKLPDIVAEARWAREVATSIGKGGLPDEPESRQEMANLELMHAVVMRLVTRRMERDEDGNFRAPAWAESPEQVQFLAKALDHLGRFRKNTVETVVMIEKRATEREQKRVMREVEKVAKRRSISAETLAEIRRGIFGLPDPEPLVATPVPSLPAIEGSAG